MDPVDMKNITVSVDDSVYHRARVLSAERGRSLSSMVRELLEGLSQEETERERLRRLENEVVARLDARRVGFHAGGRLSREEVHDRDALR